MEGAGSAVIVFRHLRRLAKSGWKIVVVSDWGQELDYCQLEKWPVFHLPHRKPWWPPYDPANRTLRNLRHWLWAGECQKFLKGVRPDAVFTYLSAFTDFMSQVAVAYSRRYAVPLSVIAHDDPGCFVNGSEESTAIRRRYQTIFQNARRNWFASPQLAEIYNLPPDKRSTLPPIPDGFDASPSWKSEFAACPLIVYAGNYWPAQLPLLAEIGREVKEAGGKLMLLTKPSPEITALCSRAPILWREPFRENREALAFLAANAAGLLVSYSESSDTMPWIRTSFPSKLIEYTHLGLPIMICAPGDSAVAGWAKSRDYIDFAEPHAPGAIGRFVESLKEPEPWGQKAAFSKTFATTEFNAERIQDSFEAGLTGSTFNDHAISSKR
jgi:hypothetical protein